MRSSMGPVLGLGAGWTAAWRDGSARRRGRHADPPRLRQNHTPPARHRRPAVAGPPIQSDPTPSRRHMGGRCLGHRVLPPARLRAGPAGPGSAPAAPLLVGARAPDRDVRRAGRARLARSGGLAFRFTRMTPHPEMEATSAASTARGALAPARPGPTGERASGRMTSLVQDRILRLVRRSRAMAFRSSARPSDRVASARRPCGSRRDPSSAGSRRCGVFA